MQTLARTSERGGHQSLTWQVTEDLGRAIVGGEYPPGSVLPNEDAISLRNGVGRSAVREAIKALEAKGLVQARPRRGTSVLSPRRWNQFDHDVQAWTRVGAPDPALLCELLEARSAFEPLAASLAAARGAPEAVRAIGLAHVRMAAAAEGRDDPFEADLAFHTAILEASGNRFLAGVLPLVCTALLFSVRVTNALRGDPVGDLAAHGRVADAIGRRDPDAARAEMETLLADVGRALAAYAALHEKKP